MLAESRSPGQRADAVKRRLRDPVALAAALGLVTRCEGGNVFVLCAWRAERTPSCSLRVYDDGIGVYCFGCGVTGTALDLIAAVHGLSMRGGDFARVLELAERVAGTSGSSSPPPSSRRRSAPPSRDAVAAFWNECTDVTTNPAVVAWLLRRGLDPDDVIDRQLARALRPYASLPPFAAARAGTWRETEHLCIIPTFDPAGQLVGVRARYVGTRNALPAKELAPIGGGGGVFADAFARQSLATGSSGTPARFIITEGGPNFLSWATAFSDADEAAPGVLGMYNGAWTSAHADRVPSGSEILIRTDLDVAGARYRATIEASLADRCSILEEEEEPSST